MKSHELRDKFIKFFEEKGCLAHPSDSLVPDDPTLLFTSAGMVQFKPYFIGERVPPRARMVTCQKCLRTGDLDIVGTTPFHHTFFEMLGNFSFGDYFKDEAITWAWEFVTERLKMPPEKLWISVYEQDDEAAEIWEKKIGIPKDRIVRFGEKSNYWPSNAPSEGPNGPCGPCSEIFYDFGAEVGCKRPDCNPDCDCGRFSEIWNLVFMQYNREEGGVLTPLPRKNIDTGMGLERVAAILQGTPTNFESDLFLPLIREIESISGIQYGKSEESSVAMRLVADHARAMVFAISDGVMPSNVGRGYVLRRIIRRAVLKAKSLGVQDAFLDRLIPVVIEIMHGPYPDLVGHQAHVSRTARAEEEKFRRTLDLGYGKLEESIGCFREAVGWQLSTLVGSLGEWAALSESDFSSISDIVARAALPGRNATRHLIDWAETSKAEFARMSDALAKAVQPGPLVASTLIDWAESWKMDFASMGEVVSKAALPSPDLSRAIADWAEASRAQFAKMSQALAKAVQPEPSFARHLRDWAERSRTDFGRINEVLAQAALASPDLSRALKDWTEASQVEFTQFAAASGAVADTVERGLPGDEAFVLYDTYGFPLELTQEIAQERGLSVDVQGFDEAMEEQRRKAREGSEVPSELFAGSLGALAEIERNQPETEFVGYEMFESPAQVVGILKDGALVHSASAGEKVDIILDVTPFYPESGGQISDLGVISREGAELRVESAARVGALIVHTGLMKSGELKTGDRVTASVDAERRRSTMRNHTATHLLHRALRMTLGEHVVQSGSHVEPNRLRFDFTHNTAISPEELGKIERIVNDEILRDDEVRISEKTLEEAKADGAMALFGEKYSGVVRVIAIPGFSMELCGGTHVSRTSRIGSFRILSEGSVGAGLRRIEAVTGSAAYEHAVERERLLSDAAEILRTGPNDVPDAVARLAESLKTAEKEIENLKRHAASGQADDLVAEAVEFNGVHLIASRVESGDVDMLSSLADSLAGKLKSGIVVLGSASDGKVAFVSKVTPDLVKRGFHAGNLVREVAKVAGGGGGGRPDFAQAGGRDASKLDEALNKAKELVEQQAKA